MTDQTDWGCTCGTANEHTAAKCSTCGAVRYVCGTMAERDAVEAMDYADRTPPDNASRTGKSWSQRQLRQAFIRGAKHGRANPLAEGELYDGTHESEVYDAG
jgi:hypothetical protein